MENKEEPFFLTLTQLKIYLKRKQRRMKRGLGAKPLLESEIKDAQKKTRSAWKLLGY